MILAIFCLFSFSVVYTYYSWVCIFRPVLKQHYLNSLRCVDSYTFNSEIKYSFDTEFQHILKWTIYYSFPSGPPSEFSPKFTAEEMERQFANVTPEHVVPTDVLLKRAGDYKQAKESHKSLLPSVVDLFEVNRFHKMSSLLGKSLPSFMQTSEMHAGVVKGDGNGTIKIPIVRKYEEEIADTRLAPHVRAKADQIIVAAVEIVNDGFASVNSDLTMAGALYDRRHKTLKNSFKGAYASRLGGAPSHVIFYPTHRVPNTDDPNDTLELSVVSRDTDFDENATLANISVRTVYAKAKGPDKVTETRHLISAKTEDAIKAQQFASSEEVVLATPRLYPSVNLDNYVLPRAKNILRTYGDYSDQSIRFKKPIFSSGGVILNATRDCPGPSKKSSVNSVEKVANSNSSKEPLHVLDEGLGCHFEDNEEDYKLGQALMDDEILEASVDMFPLAGIPETMRLLFSGSAAIPLNIVAGTKISVIYLNELATHNGVHNQLLNMVGKIPGSLRCKLFCEISPSSGIGLAITYIEGNESSMLGSNLGRLLGIQQKKWNPAIEPAVEFICKPFSCCDWWNMHYLGNTKYSPVISIMSLSKWLNAPKTDARISFALYFDPDTVLPKQVASLHTVPAHMLRKELGTVHFPQGVRRAYQFEVNFGKPQVEGKSVTMNLASAYCGLSQFMEADIVIDLLMMSSPMIGATFTLALASGSRIKNIKNLQAFDCLPHITFTFCKGSKSQRSLRFPKKLFPTYMSLDRWELAGEKPDDVGSYFILYQRDTISSSLEGDLVMRISARCSGDVVMHGVSSGYPTKATRSRAGKVNARDFGMQIRKPIGFKRGQEHTLSSEFENVYFPLAFWKYEEGKYQGSRIEEDISTHYLKMRLDGNKSSEGLNILHSPFTRLLHNCAWLKGTLEWKVVVLANSEIMKYRRTSQVIVTAHENSLSSFEFFSGTLSESSGEITFRKNVVGVVEGFKSMGWDVQGEKKFYKLCIALGNVHEYSAVYVYGRFCNDVQIAGQQKAGHYTLDQELQIFKEIPY